MWLSLKVLVHSISFLTALTNVSMLQWFLSGAQPLFLFAWNIVFSWSRSFLNESLKCVFSFIGPKKLFKSLSSSFLLYTFDVGMKFTFLFKSLYSFFEKENAAKLLSVPSGSDLYLIVSSVFLRNLTKFSLCLRWIKLHLVFLFFLFGFLFWRPLVRFLNFVGLFV